MTNCKDCQFCTIDESGRMQFKCNPFGNIIEPECLQKWTLLKMDVLLRGQQAMVNNQQALAQQQGRFGPMQDKLMKYIEREIDDIDESDKWKVDDDDDDDPGRE